MGRKFEFDFDVATGKEVSKLDGHSGTVNNVAFSPDGVKIMSGSDDKSVLVRGGREFIPLLLIAQYGMMRFSCVHCLGPAQHTPDTLPGLWGCLERNGNINDEESEEVDDDEDDKDYECEEGEEGDDDEDE